VHCNTIIYTDVPHFEIFFRVAIAHLSSQCVFLSVFGHKISAKIRKFVLLGIQTKLHLTPGCSVIVFSVGIRFVTSMHVLLIKDGKLS
jgi:hypothetical protein